MTLTLDCDLLDQAAALEAAREDRPTHRRSRPGLEHSRAASSAATNRPVVLEKGRGAGHLPVNPTSPTSRLSSSAAGHRNHAPTEAGAEPTPTNGKSPSGPSGPAALASLSTSRLRSIVARARQSHGPRRLRWENRERRAWDELCRRGMAA